MPDVVDPFTFVYRTLWAKLTGYAPLAALVGESKVRFDQTDYPANLDQVGQTVAPVLALLEAEAEWNVFAFDGQAADMWLWHPLVVMGADLNVVPVNRIRFQALRALAAAGQYLGVPRLVRDVKVRQHRVFLGEPSAWEKGHKRTVAMLSVGVLVTIKHADLLAGDGAYPTTL